MKFLNIKKYYLEIIVFVAFIVLLFLVDEKFAISNHIKKIAIGKKNKQTTSFHTIKNYYECNTNESISSIIEKTYSYSKIISFNEYKKEFIKSNKENIKNSYCIIGKTLNIPQFTAIPFQNKPLKWDKPNYAIYIRWDLATIDNILKIIENIKSTNINTLVIDAKDIVGILTYKSNDPIVQKYQNHPAIIKDFNKLVHYLHEKNIYVIVRQALFQDMNLIQYRKDLAIFNKNTPSNTIEYKGKPIWLDPGKEEVQDYNLRIFRELLSFGVDEIQFDYVRYPAEGDLSGVIYHKVKKPEDKTKHLEEFLFKAWFLKYPTETKMSIDVFGITGWQEKKDIEATGQNIPKISIFFDYISPMLYPSHFQRGFEGIDNPADYPEYFYKKGIGYFKDIIPEYVKIRPWIQAFKWRVSNYNENYILRQIKTIEENGGYGWIMWNASNNYDIPLNALKILSNKQVVSNR
jgi:hypothetical protein